MPSVTIAGLSKRSIMKVENPNSTLLSVFKSFCSMHGLNPSDYQLKDNKGKILDLSNSWKYSGLVNNTTLEIIPSSKKEKVFEPATLVFEFEEKRYEDSFDLQCTLWDVLEHWEKKLGRYLTGNFFEEKGFFKNTKKFKNPVVVHTSRQYKGADILSKTTLISLGISSKSKSIIRLSFEDIEKTKEEYEKERQMVLERKSSKQTPTPKDEKKNFETPIVTPKEEKKEFTQTPKEEKKEFTKVETPKVVQSTPKEEKKPFTQPETPKQEKKPVETPKEVSKKEEIVVDENPSNSGLFIEEKIQEDLTIDEKIEEIKEDKIEFDQETSNDNQDQVTESMTEETVESWLNRIGMSKYIDNFKNNDVNSLEIVKELTTEELSDPLGIKSFGDKKLFGIEIKKLKESIVEPNTQPKVETKKEEKKVENVEKKKKIEPKIEFKDTSKKIIPLEGVDATDVKLFKASEKSSFSKEEIDDEQFKVSMKDIAVLMKSTKEEDKVLMTQKMRDLENQKKTKTYTKCLIRVRIGEYVLQGTFKPTDKIESVEKWIKACIKNPDLSFYIFQAPPVKKFENLSATLKECNLVPASILNVSRGTKDKIEILDDLLKWVQDYGDEILPESNEEKKKKESTEKKEEVKKVEVKKEKSEKEEKEDEEKKKNVKPKWLKL